jgi:hypothetical protein
MAASATLLGIQMSPQSSNPPSETPDICLLPGCSAFSSQSVYLELNEFLTLFDQAGISATHIRVILPKGPFTLLNPSPDFDQAPLQFPTPYAHECVVREDLGFIFHVGQICQYFAADPTVSCLVFIDLDHVSKGGLVHIRAQPISVNEFSFLVPVVHNVRSARLFSVDRNMAENSNRFLRIMHETGLPRSSRNRAGRSGREINSSRVF